MDIWTKEKRSKVMSRIRGKNTKPEMILRKALFKLGYRYRIHKKDLPGKPDIVFTKNKTVIFVHGCFWHFHKDCPEGRIPSTNSTFWKEKLEKNIAKDEKNYEVLRETGWNVIAIWECVVEKKLQDVLSSIEKQIKTNKIL
jgi:DNA mismatch endonuclease, patch repair protein